MAQLNQLSKSDPIFNPLHLTALVFGIALIDSQLECKWRPKKLNPPQSLSLPDLSTSKVPYAEIQDNLEELEVRPNDPIELTCIINRSPIPPSFVFWYHEQRMINFDLNNAKARGKINLFKRNERDDTVVSKLIIFNAISADSGNYTCAPSNSAPTSIYVQVLQGEYLIRQLY